MTPLPVSQPSADRIAAAWDFAARVHNGQRVPGTRLPYLRHLGLVFMEITTAHLAEPIADIELAMCCAILHDTMEDQGISTDELKRNFGAAVAGGVSALSKNPSLPKADAMADSLDRIILQSPAVWCVKLADRISNLHGAPAHWTPERIDAYRQESRRIAQRLGAAHRGLSSRLAAKIETYPG